MNRTVFLLPAQASYRTAGGLDVSRTVTHFTGGAALDHLIDLLDRRRGVVLSSGTTVPGRYESFDMGFADPPLALETVGTRFDIRALNRRGEVLVAFLGATVLRDFGASIFTVELVGYSFLREFGVLLTAILIAGRSGSASRAAASAACSSRSLTSSLLSGTIPSTASNNAL